MDFSEKRQVTRWVIIAASFVIVSLILWNTYAFFQIIKNEERSKMVVWAQAMETINKADPATDDVGFPLEVTQHNKTIPIILVQGSKIVNTANLPAYMESDTTKVRQELERFRKENDPIKIDIAPGKYQYVYYGNSSLLNQLKYYPIALLTIIFLFALVVFNFYRSTKMATQNKLWAGMAKETAHQIGTPLSSLIGWLEIMKADNVDETTVTEIEKDIVRLQTITDRFSKIGSEPVLEPRDVVAETKDTFEYLTSRFSNQVDFSFKAPAHPVMVSINPALHSWTVENLIKNAVDAMRGRGKLSVRVESDGKFAKILVSDSGKGIPKTQWKRVFEPGFTTKKRGWGLGLSLTKRIVEDYHKGRVKVLHSEVGKGTTMQVSLEITA